MHSSWSRSMYSVSRTSFINSVYNCWKWQFYLHPPRIRLLFTDMSFSPWHESPFKTCNIFSSLFFFTWSAGCQMARYIYTAYSDVSKNGSYVRSEVFMAVTMNITFFRDVTQWSLVYRYQHFRETCYLYLRGKIVKRHDASVFWVKE
jgi:hypothetical protein